MQCCHLTSVTPSAYDNIFSKRLQDNAKLSKPVQNSPSLAEQRIYVVNSLSDDQGQFYFNGHIVEAATVLHNQMVTSNDNSFKFDIFNHHVTPCASKNGA